MESIDNNTYIENGRVKYVEPNCMRGEKNSNGSYIDAPFDPEDYCVSVDLQVEAKSNLQASGENGGNTIYVMSWNNVNKDGNHISFFKGSKLPTNNEKNHLALTTSYTDINYQDTKIGGINEGFGITSIDIDFDSWYTPTVVMRFTDVRGASLFSPEEYAHRYDNGALIGDTPGSFFKCFFTFPYPKFTLQVKGFYGKAVTYQLSCSGFKSSFNSQNGNFESEVTFLGYNYSLLTDIPMQLLKASPYNTYYGEEYWKKNAVLNGKFSLGESEQNVPMPTLVELCERVSKAPERLAELSSQSSLVKRRITCEAKHKELLKIKNAFEEYFNTFIYNDEGFITYESKGDNKNKLLIFCNPSVIDNSNHSFINNTYKRKVLLSLVNEYNKTNPSNQLPFEFSDGKIVDSPKPIKTHLTFNKQEIEIDGKKCIACTIDSDSSNNNSFSKLIDRKGNLTKVAKKDFWYDDDFLNEIKKYVNYSGGTKYNPTNFKVTKIGNNLYTTVFQFGNLYGEIEKRIKDLQRYIDDTNVEYNKFQEDAVKDIFDFKPSIRNIMKIIFAHLETFLYSVYECRKKILADTNRTMNNVGLTDKNSDINGISSKNKVPPFPQYMVESRASSNNRSGRNGGVSSTTLVNGWIGDLPYSMEEASLVYGFTQSAQEVGSKMNMLRSQIENNKDFFNVPFIPINLTDTLFNVNPYIYAGNNIVNVLTIAALRMINYLDTFSNDLNKINIKLAARCEARNYYNANENNDAEFYQILKGINYGSIYDILAGLNTTWDKRDNKHMNISDVVLPDGNRIVYNDNEGYTYIQFGNEEQQLLPVLPTNIENIKRNFFLSNDVIIPNDTSLYYTPSDKTGKKNSNIFNINEDTSYYIQLKNNIINSALDNDTNMEPLTVLWDVNKENYSNFYINDGFSKLSKLTLVSDNIDIKKYDLPVDSNTWVNNKNDIDLIPDINKYLNFFEDGEYSYKTLQNELIEKYVSKDILIDSLTLTNFRTVIDVNESCSLFGNPFFYLQNKISSTDGIATMYKVKALLFLQTLSLGISNLLNKICKGKTGILAVPKGDLLLMGGFLWREKYYKKHNRDCYIFEGDNVEGLGKIEFKDIKNHVDGDLYFYTFNSKVDFSVFKTFDASQLYYEIDKRLFALDDTYKNTLIDYFEDWVSKEYIDINDGLELKRKSDGGNTTFSAEELVAFSNKLQEIISLESKQKTGNKTALFLCETLSDNVFKNYRRVFTEKGSSLMLINRDDSDVIRNVTSLFLQDVTIMYRKPLDFSFYGVTKHTVINKTKNRLSFDVSMSNNYMSEFLRELQRLYDKKITNEANNKKNQKPVEGNINEDLCISLYQYLKTLNDRWLVANDESTYTIDRYFNNYFKFIDSYYQDIGDELIVNMDYFAESFLNLGDDRNLFSFISDLLVRHGMVFLSLPHFNDWSDAETIKSIFKPLPYHRINSIEEQPFFVCMYTSEPSRNLNITNDNGSYTFKPDTVNIDGRTPLPDVLKHSKVNGQTQYDIPAFGVVFARQNQSFFKNISVNMDNPVATEYSIKAYYDIAKNAQEGTRKISFSGQDLYSVWSNNSYTCNIEMLGCAQIQPLMYFQLLNVPMFRGAYIVTKVKHSIVPGNMTTYITGVKMSNMSRPMNVNAFNMTALMSHLTDNAVDYGYNTTLPPDGTTLNTNDPSLVHSIPSFNSTIGYYNPSQVKPEYSKNYKGLKRHMIQLFEALRETIKMHDLKFDIVLTSGARPNGRVGSDHYPGCAMDIKTKPLDGYKDDPNNLAIVFDLIMTYYYDWIGQLIWESKKSWETGLSYPSNVIHWASYGYDVDKSITRSNAIKAAEQYDDYYKNHEYPDFSGGIINNVSLIENLKNFKREIFQAYVESINKTIVVDGSNMKTFSFSKTFLKCMAKRYCQSMYDNDAKAISSECLTMNGIPNPQEYLRPFLNS